MTEAEWLTSEDPPEMVKYLDLHCSERSLILFYLSAYRRLTHLIVNEATRETVRRLEQFAEHLPSVQEWDELHALAQVGSRDATPEGVGELVPLHERATEFVAATISAVLVACHPTTETERAKDYHWAAIVDLAVAVTLANYGPTLRTQDISWPPERAALETKTQVRDLRDIFGNPFRPVAFSPSWRTDTALAIARGMYEGRDFGAMPILADALQDAGCDNADVLNHCRADGVHVRGCWVVDLVLGK